MTRARQVGHAFLILALIAGIMSFTYIAANADDASKKDPAAGKAKAALIDKKACNAKLVDGLLKVIEKHIVPITDKKTKEGNKVFGAAILKKSDLSVVVATSNTEIENPLWHGEVYAIKKFYELPRDKRPQPKDLIFLATHEPCPLCLSAITWGGYDNFFYLFGYQDTKDAFNIPHDIRILKEVFQPKGGDYARKNFYWTNYGIMDLINNCDEKTKKGFLERVEKLKKKYAEMSDAYQKSKSEGDADIPLK